MTPQLRSAPPVNGVEEPFQTRVCLGRQTQFHARGVQSPDEWCSCLHPRSKTSREAQVPFRPGEEYEAERDVDNFANIAILYWAQRAYTSAPASLLGFLVTRWGELQEARCRIGEYAWGLTRMVAIALVP